MKKMMKSFLLAYLLCHFVSIHGDLLQDVVTAINLTAQFNCNGTKTIDWKHRPVNSDNTFTFYVEVGFLNKSYSSRYSVVFDNVIGQNSLIIRNVQPSDAGTYICEVVWSKKSAELTVLDSSPSCGSNSSEGVLGNNHCYLEPDYIESTCSVKYYGNKSPDLTWQSTSTNGTLHHTGSNQTVDGVSSSRLVIRSDVVGNGIIFICKVGGYIHQCSTPAVTVLHALNSSNSVEDFTCRADTNLQQCNYKWIHKNGPTETIIHSQTIQQNDIPYGNYQCWAECKYKENVCSLSASKAAVSGTESGSTKIILPVFIVLLLVLSVLLVAFIILLYRFRTQSCKKNNADENIDEQGESNHEFVFLLERKQDGQEETENGLVSNIPDEKQPDGHKETENGLASNVPDEEQQDGHKETENGLASNVPDEEQQDGTLKLLQMASEGDLHGLKLIRARQEMSAADYDKRTALHVAAAEGHLDCVEFLVKDCHVPVRPKDRWGFTPLHEAKKFNHNNVKQYLVNCQKEFNKNISDLLFLVKDGDFNELNSMFKEGCVMTLADYDDRTALHIAADEGFLKCVKFLVEDCHVPLAPKDRWGKTPLDGAKTFGHKEVQQYLENRESESLHFDTKECNLMALKHMSHAGQDMLAAVYNGQTALHVSAANGNLQCVKFLVEECHVPHKVRDQQGYTPYDEAKRSNQKEVQEYFEGYELEFNKIFEKVRKGDLEALTTMSTIYDLSSLVDSDDRTLLHVAAAEGHLKCVTFLVEKCHVSLQPKNKGRPTPWDLAKYFKHEEVQNYLKQCEQSNPHFMAKEGNLKALEKLVKDGGNMEAADYDGRTVLHIAAAEGKLDCVQFLLKDCHVPLEPVDRWGYTPLDDAIKFEKIEVQEYLKGFQQQQKRFQL